MHYKQHNVNRKMDEKINIVFVPVPGILVLITYSKPCLKWPLKNIQNKGLNGI